MLVPDMGAAAAEIARVLRPGGRAALAVWASPDENDWMTAPGRSALGLGLVERPDPAAPGPFRLSADGALDGLLGSAGLSSRPSRTCRSSGVPDRSTNGGTSSGTRRACSRRCSPDSPRTRRRLSARAPSVASRSGFERDGSVAVPGLARVALAVRPD